MVKEVEQGRGGCKRKLTWPTELIQTALLAEDAGARSPEPHSPAHKLDDGDFLDSGCPKSACQGEVLLRSPTHDGVIFTQPEVKRARFLDLLDSSSLAGPAVSADAGAAAAIAAEPDNEQLMFAAATSSSRRSWELLFDGLQHPGGAVRAAAAAAPSPSTPAVPAVGALPPPPQKPSQHSRVGCRAPFRASRALLGMAPASNADLQQMRQWLSTLEAR